MGRKHQPDFHSKLGLALLLWVEDSGSVAESDILRRLYWRQPEALGSTLKCLGSPSKGTTLFVDSPDWLPGGTEALIK